MHYNIMQAVCDKESFLMQDEPEVGHGFSCEMSLKGVRSAMLGIDHQHGRFEGDEPGGDPGVFGWSWAGGVRCA